MNRLGQVLVGLFISILPASTVGETPAPSAVSPSPIDAWKDYLAAAGESALATNAERRAYRLVYRPSWRAPVVVIAELDRKGRTLIVKVLDGQGAVRPGKLARQYSRRLTSLEWDGLDILKTGFWLQRSEQERDQRITDGTGCLIEGVRWGEYHQVAGWNPRSNAFRAACRALLDLTAEDVPVTEFEELTND